MRTMYNGLGFFFPRESWDSHWDRCYKCIIRCSQFTVWVCFAKGLWLVRRALGWRLVLPGSYTLVQVGRWEGGGSNLSESTELENAAAVQGTTDKVVGSNKPWEWEQEAWVKQGNRCLRQQADFSRHLPETTRIHLNKGKIKRPSPCRDKNRQGQNLLSNTAIWVYIAQHICSLSSMRFCFILIFVLKNNL